MLSRPGENYDNRSLNFINEITHAMNRNDDPQQVLDQILQACIESTGADFGSIMLLNSKKDYLEMRAFRGLQAETKRLRLKVGEGVTGWVAKHGQPRLVSDTDKEGDYIVVRPGLFSELAAPMRVGGEVIGVISVDSGRRNAFHRRQQDFLSIMANLAARIFVNLQDNQRLKMRDRFHRVLIDISRVVTRSLQVEEIFREIMQITESAFRLHRSALLLYDKKAEALTLKAALGSTGEQLQHILYAPGEGISGQVFLHKKAVFIPNVRKEPDFLNRMKTDIGSEESNEEIGFFCCPIFSGTEVSGVFSTFTRKQGGIEPDTMLEFLEILGSTFSQAITIQKLVMDETQVVVFENIQLKQELSQRYRFGGRSLIGRSPAMRELFEKVRIVADSRASVLLTGESGTGKELIASALHYNSPRKDEAFVKINCAAIPTNLVESELFGHRRGAFTGAIANKKGKFEMAHGGTIFLDEIGELDLNMQSKLLRVLQEREIEPVGGQVRSVDIRVIAATNSNLQELIVEKKFRTDLFYRLNVIHLQIPPLRERREDILALVHHFINKYSQENGKQLKSITARSMQLLENHDWPGNVRQLENVIERVVVLGQQESLSETDFLDAIQPFPPTKEELQKRELTRESASLSVADKSGNSFSGNDFSGNNFSDNNSSDNSSSNNNFSDNNFSDNNPLDNNSLGNSPSNNKLADSDFSEKNNL